MKVQLLARPDHALYLYRGIKNQIDVKMLNFNCFHENSIQSKLYPHKKTVDSDVTVLHSLTMFKQLLINASKFVNFDMNLWENKFSEFIYEFNFKDKENTDLIHYWPFYCHKFIKKLRDNQGVITLADIHQVHPFEGAKELESVYKFYNLNLNQSHFIVNAERSLEFLEHENNVIVPSKYVADTYLKYYPNLNISIAQYGLLGGSVEMNNQDFEKNENSKLKFVFVGTVSLEKGVHTLIEAALKTKSDITLIGPIEEKQRHIFEPHFNKENIHFVGKIPNSSVKTELKKYDVFVLPSLSDAYSLAVIEAISCGLPVIVSNKTGNAFDVELYGLGEVATSQSVESLSETLLAFNERDKINFYKENILNYLKEENSFGYPDRVLKIYSKLLKF